LRPLGEGAEDALAARSGLLGAMGEDEPVPTVNELSDLSLFEVLQGEV
jgi:hypothetical protein